MDGLLSLSPEILTRVFQHCHDLPHNLALASTCKFIYSVWETNSSAVIWEVVTRGILCFDVALMAVRATALQNGSLPVIPSIEALSGGSQKPNWQELKEVQNMQNLVQCLESMFLHSQELVYNLAGFRMPDTIWKNRPVHIKEHLWQERFYGGMYRTLLASAAVAGGYLEPYLDAENNLDNDIFQHTAGKKVIEYFRKFMVYNFDILDDSEIGTWRYEEHEKIFGPFARWIVGDGRAAELAVVEQDKRDAWARNSGEKGSVYGAP